MGAVFYLVNLSYFTVLNQYQMPNFNRLTCTSSEIKQKLNKRKTLFRIVNGKMSYTYITRNPKPLVTTSSIHEQQNQK